MKSPETQSNGNVTGNRGNCTQGLVLKMPEAGTLGKTQSITSLSFQVVSREVMVDFS